MTSRLLRYTESSTGPLRKNSKHQFAVRHAMAIYARNTVCTFIPKNACTVLRYNVALENQVIGGPEGSRWIHENNSTFQPSHNELVTAAYTFAILRCPFRRLVSCFLHKIVNNPELAVKKQGRANSWTWFQHWRPGQSRAVQRQATANGDQGEADLLSFADFVAFLEAPGGLGADIHWRPQIDFLVYRDYDDVFRLEDMSRMMATVQAKVGFNIRDAELFTGHGNLGRARIEDGFFGRTQVGDLRRLKNAMKVPAYERLYDADLYRRVSKLYQADIELYANHFGQSALLQLP